MITYRDMKRRSKITAVLLHYLRCLMQRSDRKAIALGLCVTLMISCAHTIHFARFGGADRMVVLTRLGQTVKTIDDPDQIKAAVQFIQKFESGWKDPLAGPLVPQFMFHFFSGSRGIGGYGIGVGYIVADPPTDGFWSRDVPVADVTRLATLLGLQFEQHQ